MTCVYSDKSKLQENDKAKLKVHDTSGKTAQHQQSSSKSKSTDGREVRKELGGSELKRKGEPSMLGVLKKMSKK